MDVFVPIVCTIYRSEVTKKMFSKLKYSNEVEKLTTHLFKNDKSMRLHLCSLQCCFVSVSISLSLSLNHSFGRSVGRSVFDSVFEIIFGLNEMFVIGS